MTRTPRSHGCFLVPNLDTLDQASAVIFGSSMTWAVWLQNHICNISRPCCFKGAIKRGEDVLTAYQCFRNVVTVTMLRLGGFWENSYEGLGIIFIIFIICCKFIVYYFRCIWHLCTRFSRWHHPKRWLKKSHIPKTTWRFRYLFGSWWNEE